MFDPYKYKGLHQIKLRHACGSNYSVKHAQWTQQLHISRMFPVMKQEAVLRLEISRQFHANVTFTDEAP